MRKMIRCCFLGIPFLIIGVQGFLPSVMAVPAVVSGEGVYFILHEGDPDNCSKMIQQGTKLTLESTQMKLFIGLSSHFESLRQLYSARKEADLAADYARYYS